MAARVFKIHKRVVKPGEEDITYSLDDFSKMETEMMEKSQFYIHNSSQSFELREAFYFEIKRQTL